MDEIKIEDFDDIKICGWTADNKLREFFIEKHNGEIKTLDFTKLISALKLQKLVKEKINQELVYFDGVVDNKTFADLNRQHMSTKITLELFVTESEKDSEL